MIGLLVISTGLVALGCVLADLVKDIQSVGGTHNYEGTCIHWEKAS